VPTSSNAALTEKARQMKEATRALTASVHAATEKKQRAGQTAARAALTEIMTDAAKLLKDIEAADDAGDERMMAKLGRRFEAREKLTANLFRVLEG
jgi:tRNA C32,U32 (ribose-2'-O)-methylase TrmJ